MGCASLDNTPKRQFAKLVRGEISAKMLVLPWFSARKNEECLGKKRDELTRGEKLEKPVARDPSVALRDYGGTVYLTRYHLVAINAKSHVTHNLSAHC